MEYTSYEKFCFNIQKAIEKHCKEGVKVNLQTVRKVNGITLKGITIAGDSSNIMPTLYLDKYYREYEEGMPFEEVVDLFLEEYERAGVKEDFDIQFFSDYEKVMPHLAFKLVHYEMNKELLAQIPHKPFLDLAIVCFCDIKDKRIGHGSILIRCEHLDLWKVTEEQLIQDAMSNMPKLYPADFMNMAEVLRELYKDPANLLAISLPMFVLTNKERLNGAASILYEGQLEQIGNILGNDYYILPSSIHEVIILPKSKGTDENYLSQMVDEINHEQLAREEILANHAYFYKRDTKELKALPLVPYKKDSHQ